MTPSRLRELADYVDRETSDMNFPAHWLGGARDLEDGLRETADRIEEADRALDYAREVLLRVRGSLAQQELTGFVGEVDRSMKAIDAVLPGLRS